MTIMHVPHPPDPPYKPTRPSDSSPFSPTKALLGESVHNSLRFCIHLEDGNCIPPMPA
jgi:hypothetical protein